MQCAIRMHKITLTIEFTIRISVMQCIGVCDSVCTVNTGGLYPVCMCNNYSHA